MEMTLVQKGNSITMVQASTDQANETMKIVKAETEAQSRQLDEWGQQLGRECIAVDKGKD